MVSGFQKSKFGQDRAIFISYFIDLLFLIVCVNVVKNETMTAISNYSIRIIDGEFLRKQWAVFFSCYSLFSNVIYGVLRKFSAQIKYSE